MQVDTIVQKNNTKDQLIGMIREALREARADGVIHSDTDPKILIEVPKREGQGDYATGIAMTMAAVEGQPPREIAERLVRYLRNDRTLLWRVEVAGPGFINFTLKADWWRRVLFQVHTRGGQYGKADPSQGRKIQIEFVSANPTGPLHVGHGRWAAFGNALANLLEMAGHRVQKEYYNNDSGRQVKLLGLSVYSRYQRLLGHHTADPDEGYRGEYITGLAQKIMERLGKKYRAKKAEDCLDLFIQLSVEEMTASIREDLEAFGVRFDHWFSEASLYQSGKVQSALDELKEKGFIFEQDGAQWFSSRRFGDDKDRVVRKEDGEFTYLAPDIAYHKDKLSRGFDQLINIWGADHHGYTARMEAVVQALGYPRSKLKILIGQLVSLIRGGKPVPMSKRAGEFITLADVVSEVGKDAALFFFLMRRLDTHLEFDLELAKRQSNENPVYYVQYAHARLCSVMRQAREQGIRLKDPREISLTLLVEPEELKLMKRLAFFPELILESAQTLEPHRLTFYLLDLAGILHHYYFKHRIISDDRELCQARLLLADSVRTVMANALGVLGVSAPERM